MSADEHLNNPLPPFDATSYLHDFNIDYFNEPLVAQAEKTMRNYTSSPGRSTIISNHKKKLLEFTAFLKERLRNPRKADYLTSLIRNSENFQHDNYQHVDVILHVNVTLYILGYLMSVKDVHPEIFNNITHQSLYKFLNH